LPELISNNDAIIVTTPINTHYEVVKQVLEAGKHCFVEKPLCDNLKEGYELCALAEKQGVVLQVGHIEQFNSELIKECNPVHITAIRDTNQIIFDSVLDLMIHDIEIVQRFVSKPILNVKLNSKFYEKTALVSFVDSPVTAEFRVIQNIADTQRKLLIAESDGSIREVNLMGASNNALEDELTNFVDSCLGQAVPKTDGWRALRAVHTALRIKSHGGNTKVWQPANIYPTAMIGNDVSIGAFSEIGNNVVIGDKTRVGSSVFIPEGVYVGKDVFLGPRVTFANDKFPPSGKENWKRTIVEDGARIGANVSILPGVRIGAGSLVGMGSEVTKDVAPGVVVYGNPAKDLGSER
jgi:acetyltransferase-like isoleucine patch superfamily enzyme